MSEFTGIKVSTFRERFFQLCEESQKSATAIAKDLHVSKPTISAWKSGDRSPKQPTVITIAEYFNVSIEWLMGFDVEKEAPETDNEQRMPIFVPDSEMFAKIVSNMSAADYRMIMEAFERTYNKMKERGMID